MNKQERKIKVGYKFLKRTYSQSVVVPEIKLCGKWLQELNFQTGMDVKIEVENQRLIITPILGKVAEPKSLYKSKKK